MKDSSSSDSFEQWKATLPILGGNFAVDRASLSRHVLEGEHILANLQLPAGNHIADQLIESSRKLRRRFMALHAHRVYDELTASRNQFLRLDDLARAAAESFPGLVPTIDQLKEEKLLMQADKMGREIDQAIFFSAIFQLHDIGSHLMSAMLQPRPDAEDALSIFQEHERLKLMTLTLTRHNGVTYINIENLNCLNAEDGQLIADMETAVDVVLLDEATRVAVVRGGVMTHPKYRGRRVFSAGINLVALRDGQISFVDFMLQRELGYIHKILRGLRYNRMDNPDNCLAKPWIAAVDSFAIGGGMQLLLVFDYVIAADDAFFSLPAANEGLVPGVANLRLPRRIGDRAARQVILGGRRIHASDPEASLLCDEIVPADEIDYAIERAASLFDNAAVRTNRKMLIHGIERFEDLRKYMASFANEQASRLYSSDVIHKNAAPTNSNTQLKLSRNVANS